MHADERSFDADERSFDADERSFDADEGRMGPPMHLHGCDVRPRLYGELLCAEHRADREGPEEESGIEALSQPRREGGAPDEGEQHGLFASIDETRAPCGGSS